jgi:hypothetical protein
LSGGGTITAAQEVIEAISIYWLSGTNDPGQLGRINRG